MTQPQVADAYHETFLLYDYDADDNEIANNPRWACGICHGDLDATTGVCPEHCPAERPGPTLVPCEATPRCPQMWIIEQCGGYGPGCLFCAYSEERAKHRSCDHDRHGHWRGWKITRLAVRWLARAEIITGHTTGNICGGPGVCVTNIRWRWTR